MVNGKIGEWMKEVERRIWRHAWESNSEPLQKFCEETNISILK